MVSKERSSFRTSNLDHCSGLPPIIIAMHLIHSVEYIPSMIESLEGATGKLTLQDPWVA
jgi:hypothetical protein